MKSFLLVPAFILLSLSRLAAQGSNVIFFSEEGEKFYVIMNGLRQNNEPQTNVKVSGIPASTYKVKIIFQDTAFGVSTKTIGLDPSSEQTYNIRRRNDAKGLGADLKAVGKGWQKDLGGDTATKELYVLRLLSNVNIAQAAPPASSQQVVVYSPAPAPVVSGSSSTTVVTTTTPPTTGTNTGVNMNVNVGGVGMGMNMNVYDQTTTSQTTTVTTTGGPATTVVYVPGYAGPIGCPMPMAPGDFANAKNSISSKDFESTKLDISKQIVGGNCLTSAQVKEVMQLFDFEASKLDFAKFAYGHTYDKGNYFVVNDAFDFESSVSDLNAYISGH